MATESDHQFMDKALALAEQASLLGEVPVGAVLVINEQVVAQAYNRPIATCDASAHAEIIALREAGRVLGNYRLPHSTLYVTLEPCTMCVGALIHARVERVVFAAPEPKAGALMSQLKLMDMAHWNHRLQFEGGVEEDRAKALLQSFFKARRERVKELKKRCQSPPTT